MLQPKSNSIFCWLITTALFASVLGTIGCELGPTLSSGGSHRDDQLSGKLKLSGSSTLAPLVAEAAAQFEAIHPGVRIDVQTGGSSRGIRDTQKGIVDLGMASRGLKPDEAAECVETVVAWDGVGFVIHRDNPIGDLQRSDLINIYQGNLKRWSELGGKDAPIIVSNRAEGRSELDLVTQHLDLQPTQIRADVIDGETQQSLKTVINNPNAITYTSIGAAQHAIENGSPLRLLPLDGVEATSDNVRTRNYPLARPLILIRSASATTPSELESAFVEFLTSSTMEETIIGLGFVPATPQ